MKLRKLTDGLVEYVMTNSDNFDRKEVDAFRTVIAHLQAQVKIDNDLEEAVSLNALLGK
jgi:hypothetical protein